MVQLSVLQLLSWAGLDLHLYCQQSLQATQALVGSWESGKEKMKFQGFLVVSLKHLLTIV